MALAPPKPATFDDAAALGDDVYVEVLAGEIVPKAAPSAEHADAQAALGFALGSAFHRRGGGGAPGGWWLLPECDVELAVHDVVRLGGVAQVAGRRAPHRAARSHRPGLDLRDPLGIERAHRPEGEARALHQHRVRPYWIVDPERETLTVHRWAEGGYLVTMVATRGDVVRAEPFEAIELRVGLLFGDDLDDASTGS